jgi:ribosome-associated protein
MIFAEGRSNKNVGAIASYLADELKNAGVKQVNIEGLEKSEWVLIEADGIFVHLLHPEIRQYYKIEELWEARIKGMKKGQS